MQSLGPAENLGTFGICQLLQIGKWLPFIPSLLRKVVISLPLFRHIDCFEDTCRELYVCSNSHIVITEFGRLAA